MNAKLEREFESCGDKKSLQRVAMAHEAERRAFWRGLIAGAAATATMALVALAAMALMR